MSFMAMPSVNEELAYGSSFGNLANKTKYWDPFMKIDRSNDIMKAINTTASSGAAGYALTPLVYDPKVIDITRYQTPLLGMIPKVTNLGTTANYYRITKKPTAAWGSEQGGLNESDSTKEQLQENIKYCRVTGKVAGVAEVGSKHFIDSVRQEVMLATTAMNEELEDTLINGDSSTNPLEPDGLINLLDSNNVNMSGDPVAVADVKQLVADCWNDKGHPNLIITDSYTGLELENQMMDFVRYVNPMQMNAFGLESLTINTQFGRLPVIPSQFMPTTDGERRILVIDTQQIEQRVLQDIIFSPLAKTEDAEKFYLKTYRTLINKFPEGMGQIYGIGASA